MLNEMIYIKKGMRGALANSLNVEQEILLQMEISGPSTYDYCCFGLDGSGKLSDPWSCQFTGTAFTRAGLPRFEECRPQHRSFLHWSTDDAEDLCMAVL